MAQRPTPAVVIVRKKLRLISCDIHADRTIALAAFARQAEVQRRLHVRIVPPLADHLASGHLPKQMGAATSGVFLVPDNTKARAHHSTFVLAAFPNSNTSQSGLRNAPVIMRKLEVQLWLPGFVACSEPEILIQFVRQYQLAGIHFPIRIPQSFELAESLHQLRTKHFRKKLSTRLTIPVFS